MAGWPGHSEGIGAMKIERVGTITVEEFEQEYVQRRLPVITTTSPKGWAPLSWTPRYLSKVLGSRTIKLSVSANEKFDYDHETLKQLYERETTSVGHALSLMSAPEKPRGPHYYMLQQNLNRDFPELRSALDPRPTLLGDRPAFTGLWAGGAGNVTPLHYDETHNLYIQVYGRKHFKMFEPGQAQCLYPTDVPRDPFLSRVDVHRPDLERFPRFPEAEHIDFTLEPGDTLYLPAFWWHSVLSLDVAISVNFWWAPAFVDLLAPAALRLLPLMFRQNGLRRYRAAFSDNPKEGFVGLAGRAWQLGQLWVAVLFAAAALDEHLRALCAKRGLTFPGFEQMNEALTQARVYSKKDADQVAAWTVQFTKAEKAQGPFSNAEVRRLIDAQRDFMARVPAPVPLWELSPDIVGT